MAFVSGAHTWEHRVPTLMNMFFRVRDERRIMSWNSHRTSVVRDEPAIKLAAPLNSSAASHVAPYLRPNRPLIAVLFNASAACSGVFVRPCPADGDLTWELAQAFLNRRFQHRFRVHFIGLRDGSSFSQPQSSRTPHDDVIPGAARVMDVDITTVEASLFDASHPLHALWHRYQALVGVGELRGLVLPTLQRWNNRSAASLSPHVLGVDMELLPKSVFVALDASLDADAVRHQHGVDVLVVRPPNNTRVATPLSLLPTPGTSALPLRVVYLSTLTFAQQPVSESRALELRRVLDDVLLRAPLRGWMEVTSPPQHSWVLVDAPAGHHSSALHINVLPHDMSVPKHGSWDVTLNGTRVRPTQLQRSSVCL